jgi:hypothetical protein
MATTYPDGYSGARKTIEEVFLRPSVQMLHPEYQKRWRALMIASGGKLGIGGAGRSSSQQERVFLERHYVVSSGGCCYYAGKRYQLKKGAAHAAPPGRSFHEQVVFAAAAAVDAVGDLAWAAQNCEAYGLEQATWGGEDWHFQFTEYPHSVTQWKAQGSPAPQNWKFPGQPPTTSALVGPDVSKWNQGLVPPDPHGIDFGICRASIGLTPDPVVSGVTAWCRQRKIPFCAYHFVFESADHPAAAQAETFHKAVGGDASISCMLDWETGPKDYCHPTSGHEQHATWSDVLGVAAAIRKLGHRCALVYTANWYWSEQGKPTMSGGGLDLVNAQIGPEPRPTGSPSSIYAARGGDFGPGWVGYGGLEPVLWQYSHQAIWGNQQLDFNAFLGTPAELGRWFTTWQSGSPPSNLEDDDMLFVCKEVISNVTTYYVGDGVRATKVAPNDVDTLKANIEGTGTARWRHPARSGLPVLTKIADVPAINAGQRDCLVGKLV